VDDEKNDRFFKRTLDGIPMLPEDFPRPENFPHIQYLISEDILETRITPMSQNIDWPGLLKVSLDNDDFVPRFESE